MGKLAAASSMYVWNSTLSLNFRIVRSHFRIRLLFIGKERSTHRWIESDVAAQHHCHRMNINAQINKSQEVKSFVPSLAELRRNLFSSSSCRPTTNIILPGGGLFFFWQAGAIHYLLQEGYDLTSSSHVKLAGASAGAIAAALTTSKVDFLKATHLALQYAEAAKLWETKRLRTVWGLLIEQWLTELLPLSASDMANRQVSKMHTV